MVTDFPKATTMAPDKESCPETAMEIQDNADKQVKELNDRNKSYVKQESITNDGNGTNPASRVGQKVSQPAKSHNDNATTKKNTVDDLEDRIKKFHSPGRKAETEKKPRPVSVPATDEKESNAQHHGAFQDADAILKHELCQGSNDDIVVGEYNPNKGKKTTPTEELGSYNKKKEEEGDRKLVNKGVGLQNFATETKDTMCNIAKAPSSDFEAGSGKTAGGSSLKNHTNCFCWNLGVFLFFVGASLFGLQTNAIAPFEFYVPPSLLFDAQNPDMSVKEQLRFVVSSHQVSHNLTGIQDFQTEGYHAHSINNACAKASSYAKLKTSLLLQLGDFPAVFRDKVIERALVPEVSQTNRLQDSVIRLGEDGNAEVFLAFWATFYNPHDQQNLYESCVSASRVSVQAAPVIIGYQVEKKKKLVAHESCHCGFFYCGGTCPVFDEEVVKTPVLKRISMDLNQQHSLHELLVQRAINEIQSVQTTNTLPGVQTTKPSSDLTKHSTLQTNWCC